MTTEQMEVWSLEEGDHVRMNGEVYFVQVIEPTSSTTSTLWLVDEEGFQHSVVVEDSQKISVVVLDNADAVL